MDYTRAFHVGAALSTAAAPMILHPWAFYVAATIGTWFSNPEGMDESAGNWRTTDKSGGTTELDELVTAMNSIKTELEDGKWEGGAYQQFEEAHSNFIRSVGQLEEIRNDTGDAVASNATVLKVLAVASALIGYIMFAWGLWCVISRLTPGTAISSQIMSVVFGRSVLTTLRTLMTKHWKVAAIVSVVMYALVQYTETTGKAFPFANAIPTEMSMMGTDPMNMRQPFTNDGLRYDENTGQLIPDTTMEV